MRNINPFPFITVFAVCLVLLYQNASAQQNFRIRYDNSLNNIAPNKVIVGNDGGYAMFQGTDNIAFTNWHSYLMKTDSSGTFQWFKQLPFGSPQVTSVGIDVLPTADSGFIYAGAVLDYMFDTYPQSVLHRMDSQGNILNSKATFWGNFANKGNAVYPRLSHFNSDEHFAFSHVFFYDGFSGPCCDQLYLLKFNSSLNLNSVTRLVEPGATWNRYNAMEKIITNDTITGYVLGTRSGARVTMIDTSANILWTRIFMYSAITKIMQDDSSIVLLGNDYSNGSTDTSYLHKIDFNGNTVYVKAITSGERTRLTNITKKDSTYLLSGFSVPFGSISYTNWHGLMVQTDLNGEILQSFRSPDSLYTSAGLDTMRKAFLFTRYPDPVSTTGFLFERIYIDNPACSFDPYLVISTDTLIADTAISRFSVTDTLNFLNANSVSVNNSMSVNYECGLTALPSWSDSKDSFTIFPNPAEGNLNVYFDQVSSDDFMVVIHDMTGRQLVAVQVFRLQKHISIPVATFSPGLYTLNAFREGYRQSKKFMIR